jgi:hypothetical protein
MVTETVIPVIRLEHHRIRNFLIGLAAIALIVVVAVYMIGGGGRQATQATIQSLEDQASALTKNAEVDKLKAQIAVLEAKVAAKEAAPAPAVTAPPAAPAVAVAPAPAAVPAQVIGAATPPAGTTPAPAASGDDEVATPAPAAAPAVAPAANAPKTSTGGKVAAITVKHPFGEGVAQYRCRINSEGALVHDNNGNAWCHD